MSNPFSSAYLKIDRAKYHIDDLHRGIVGINSKDSYEVVIEADSQPGYNVHKFRLRRPIPFDWFSGVTGDAISNLRSALDHAMYACAIASGNVSPIIGTCNFPFARDESKFTNKVNGCTSVPEEIRTLLKTFRPYETGHFFLWALNHMRNWDEHSLITPVLMGFDHITVQFHAAESAIEPPTNPLWDNMKNQIDLFRTKADPKYNFTVSLGIGLDRPRGVAGHRVDAILNGFLAVVEAIVTRIEAETRRLFPAAFS
jgi:hypothetical protein